VNPEPSELARLLEGARALGAAVDSGAGRLLLRYLEELYAWNVAAGLTRIPREDAVRLHLLDALSVLPLLEGVRRLADLGSGGGIPGIPIAVARPQTEVDLVESKRRRCSFLQHAVRVLGLDRCRVVEADAAALAREAAGRYEAVVARAFAPPAKFVAMARPLLAFGGKAVVMGGPRLDEAAVERAAGGWGRVALRRRLVLPGGRVRRTLLVVERRR